MIIILGLVIVVAAVIVGVAGVLTNGGSGHGLGHGFAVFGYHVTSSTGTLFLYGIVVGAVGVFGLWLLLTGARRASRRGRAARRGLKESRRETAAVTRERDDLIDQRDTGRADAASALANPEPGASPGHSPDDDSQLSPDEGRRPAPSQPPQQP
jgi:Sec-independent protein translocase protein TatA